MSSPITVFIVDDEQAALDSITKVLASFFDNVEVVGTARSVAEAYKAIPSLSPQLVLLDIEMGAETGFNLLELFDEIPFHVAFLTAHEEYALKAIKFSAIDYIIKPAGISELKQLFEKITAQLTQTSDNASIRQMFGNFLTQDKNEHKIGLPIVGGIEFVKVGAIFYITADGSYTHFNLNGEQALTVSKNLKYFEGILKEYGFFRIHNSTLINLRYIKQINHSGGGFVIMEDDAEFSISKSRKEEFKQVLSV